MATAARQDAARPLPPNLRRGLRAVGRRWRGLTALGGLGRLLLALALGLALGVAADVLLRPPSWARWGLWLGWAGAGLWLLARGVIGPLVRRLAPAELAALAARSDPALAATLVGAVELTRAGSHGSPTLIAALADRADAEAAGRPLARAVPARPAGRWLAAGGVAALAVALPPLLRPDPFAGLVRRFVAPWSDARALDRFAVVITPGDATLAAGSDLAVAAEFRPALPWAGAAPRAAWLEWTGADGVARRVAMSTATAGAAGAASPPPGGFAHTLQGLAANLSYRVVSDGARSASHTVTVVEPPAVAALTARVEPPAYTGRAAFEASDPARLNVWEGSRVTLALTPTRPLARAAVRWPGAAAELPLAPTAEGGAWTATVEAEGSGPYGFAIEDRDGLAGRSEPARRVRVVADAAPEVELAGVSETLDARRDDVIVLDVAARDDVAVAAARVGYEVERAAAGPPLPRAEADPDAGRRPAELAGLGSPEAAGQPALALAGLGLRNGDLVTYWVEVEDNRPAPKGPNVTRSAARTVRVVEQAEPLATRAAAAERAGLKARLEAIRRAATGTHQAATQLRYAADAVLRGNGKWEAAQEQALDARLAESRGLVAELEGLARDLKDSGTFRSLARPARQAGEVEADGARARLDEAKRAADPTRRLADLRAADGRLGALKERLDDLARRFDDLARRDDDLRQLRLLAERQAELAARAEALARQGVSPADLDRLRQEQEALQRQLDDLTRRSPELKAELLARRAREAGALAERARALAERQRAEARRTNDAGARQGAMQDLARRQRALEEDARRLALDVDAGLQDNGRGRVDTGVLDRAAQPLERGDAEQARPALEQAEDALMRLARDLDDVRDDPNARARRLARRQEELALAGPRAIREATTPEAKAALPATLAALAPRQQAVAQQVADLARSVPGPQRDAARQAVEATARAADDLREAKLDPTPDDLAKARDALNRLADAWPDRNALRQQAQGPLNEARGRTEEVARELERHLRETAPQPGRPTDPVASARELSRRIEPLAARADEAAALLAELDAGPGAEAARDRAARRARALADAVDRLRQVAPPESSPGGGLRPLTDWRILGPFAAGTEPMFPLGGFLDLKAVVPDRRGRPATWKPVVAGDRGLVNLGAAYPDDRSQAAAFGVVEFASPGAGPGMLALGSDDSIVAWLNGQKVFEFAGNRALGFEQDRVPVELVAGTNRLIVRCGNGDGEWTYAVSLASPPDAATAARLARVEALRRALPPLAVDARAGIDRLQQTLQGREPADGQAAELAEDLQELARSLPAAAPEGPARAESRRIAGAGARRIATALRALEAPDAAAARTEAVRRADLAAQALADDPPAAPAGAGDGTGAAPPAPADPARALGEAAEAARALARRLSDAQAPGESLAALARAQRGLDAPGAPRPPADQAKAQRAIADDLARLVPPPDAPEAEQQARRRADAALAEAATLADRVATGATPADPAATAERRRAAAEALDDLARAAIAAAPAPRPDRPEAAPDPAAGPLLARAEPPAADRPPTPRAGDPPAPAPDAPKPNSPAPDAPKPDGPAPDAPKPTPDGPKPAAADAKGQPEPKAEGAPTAKPADPRADAAALAERQRAIAAEVKAAAERVAQAPEADRAAAQAAEAGRMAALGERQDELAESTLELPNPQPPGGEARRGVERPRAEAHRAQERVAEALVQGDPARAAAEAERAAQALQQVAQALPEPAPPPVPPAGGPELAAAPGAGAAGAPDPEAAEAPITPPQAAQARDLARRQRQLRQQMQAILGEGVAPQEALRDQAADLGRALAELRDQTRDLSGRAQGPAQNASELLQNRAAPSMAQGAEQLARGALTPAREAQRQAADFTEQAARAAEDVAAALQADIPADARPAAGSPGGPGAMAGGGPPGPGEPGAGDGPPGAGGDPGDLAAARDAQRQAGQQLAEGRDAPPGAGAGEDAAAAASDAMQRAARGLRSAAQQARSALSGPGGPPSPGSPPGADAEGGAPQVAAGADPKGGAGAAVDPHTDPLTAALRPGSGRVWGELPGHLRTEILQNAGGQYRDDYARLIQLYFREIAGARPGR